MLASTLNGVERKERAKYPVMRLGLIRIMIYITWLKDVLWLVICIRLHVYGAGGTIVSSILDDVLRKG
jgi:hypothetical protein